MFINVLTIYYHRKDKKTFNLRENIARIETTPQEISPLSPLIEHIYNNWKNFNILQMITACSIRITFSFRNVQANKNPWKARDYKVDLDSRLNKTQVVTMADGSKDGSAGYYCEVCDCVIKDSMNFLDHINGNLMVS